MAFLDLLDAYEEAAERINLGQTNKINWKHVLMINLNHHVDDIIQNQRCSDLIKALQSVRNSFRDAKKKEQISTPINILAQRKLEELARP